MAPDDLDAVASGLARWFEAGHRDLPWRATRDPYAIWVSEVMLQQTRVETVTAYYEPFLRRFPTVRALASAAQDEVLSAWSGLGYYRRARLLHAGAQYVVETCGGEVPGEVSALREVPGIGPYTAGAIASIAFDVPAALVDGNVARVLSRLEAVADPREQGATAKRHWGTAGEIVDRGRPRVLAQAMMELGATVCTPKSPRCEACPVSRQCQAHARGLQGEIPAPKKRAPSPVVPLDALVVRWGDRLLLERRPDEGLLRGMWSLPLVSRTEIPADGGYATHLGVEVRATAPRTTTIRHVFTHRIWEVRLVDVSTRTRPRVKGGATARMWLRPGERPASGGTPTLTEKMLEALGV